MTRMNGLLAGATALWLCAPAAAQSPGTAQAGLERSFDQQISAAEQLAWLKEMSAGPNHVGSPHNKANAEMQLALFRQWGWDARIERFDVLYPTPISTTLELVTPERVALGGQEPAIEGDATSSALEGALPPYVAYQGDGDVTAPVVYVNYGMPEDYEALARRGISVKGKIVIARYGVGWRGLKPRLAQEHGAVGCLIYSDPADDGYAEHDPYPKGGARPPVGVQRGSVQDLPHYPGDPTTPGVGSTSGVRRISREQAETILKIPVLPVSYGDAIRIMQSLEGPVVTGRSRGALGMAYHWGGTDRVKVRLAVRSDWSLKPVYDVIATLRGRSRPDEWIVRGNHRDAWVFGANDPLSGQVALMAEAKALGALARNGWRPERTIVYASWDAEEPGLLGSTEWAETHADELRAKAVMYINTDGNGRGFLSAEGSHSLQHFVNEAARDVADPQTGTSVHDRLGARIRAGAFADQSRPPLPGALEAARTGGDLPLGPLGSGSDYTAFLQHLGVPSLNLAFSGEGADDGVYHSVYDSYDHLVRFDDPGLAYGPPLAKLVGRLVLRASSGTSSVSRYGDFARTVSTYVGEVKKLAADQRERDRALRDLTRDGAFRLSSDPGDPTTAPTDVGITPVFDMLPLEEASDRLARAARAADAAIAALGDAPPAERRRVESALEGIDQLLLDKDGLPGRPWYRNMIYAPGTLTGYGSKTLPGIREGIEQRRFEDVRAYVLRTAAVLNAYSARLEKAATATG